MNFNKIKQSISMLSLSFLVAVSFVASVAHSAEQVRQHTTIASSSYTVVTSDTVNIVNLLLSNTNTGVVPICIIYDIATTQTQASILAVNQIPFIMSTTNHKTKNFSFAVSNTEASSAGPLYTKGFAIASTNEVGTTCTAMYKLY